MRARIFAKAVSRAVERSSPKGEKPQSSVVPSWISQIGDDRERFDDAQNLPNRPGRRRLALRQFL
jgi:hypothetical protein